MTDGYTDIRLVPVTAEHHAALNSTDPEQIARAVVYIIRGYEASPPLTIQQAAAYTTDVLWWRDEISDL